jgi:hypothetical protein
MMKNVLQPWVWELTLMQQSVLIAAVRGPDGLRKDHSSKLLCRWLRRSFMLSAFDGKALNAPDLAGGGSFTGPSLAIQDYGLPCIAKAKQTGVPVWHVAMMIQVQKYLKLVDEMPHHFQLHFMHAAEILGYKHPDWDIRKFWKETYLMIVNDAHLRPEPEADMDQRLGDSESQWRSAEIVTADPPAKVGICQDEKEQAEMVGRALLEKTRAATESLKRERIVAELREKKETVQPTQPWWMAKVAEGEDFIIVEAVCDRFIVVGFRKDSPRFNYLGDYSSMGTACGAVDRLYNKVREISVTESYAELGASRHV